MANQGDRVDSPAEAPTVDVRGSDPSKPDSFDAVLKRVVATKSSSADLAPGTLIANRFRIEKMLGAGGMGTVYQALDETLARSVAIKLHHAPAGAVRLRREAVAMARLAHPNVVTVFEAGEHEGHPFVVMELITGTTLRSWLAEKPRSVAEIVDVMTAAGRGLAAAHDAGLLHRDIKPENVLIGADGRARVGDFGLARDVDSKEDPPLEGAARILSPMTQTGAVLGTPAYMAPEQLTGETIDGRADQFAFCVTMWEALYKERPYQGANFDELVKALETGKRRPPPATPRVPSKIRAALEKGLATKRDDRFTNMHGLLAALKLPVPRYAIAGGAAVAALAAGGVWFAMRPAPAPSCDNAGAKLEALIPRDLPDRLRAVGATDAAKYVADALDRFHRNVADAARTSCEGRRDWSPELAAKSDACMRVVVLGGVHQLTFDKITPEQVPDVVRRVNLGVPELYECTSPTALAAAPAVPKDPKELDAYVMALADARIAQVEMGDGRADRAKPFVDRLEASPMREWPAIKAQRMLLQAMAASEHGDKTQSVKLATELYYTARANDDDDVLTGALILLLNIGSDGMDNATLQTWVRTAIADAERLAKRSPSTSGALYSFLAHIADYQGQPEAGLDFVKKARATLRPGSEMSHELDAMEASLLMSSGQAEKGMQLYESTIQEQSARVGADHPIIGSILSEYSANLIGAERYDKALVAAQRAVQILAKYPDANHATYDAARGNLANALNWLDRPQDAALVLEPLRQHYIKDHGPHSRQVLEIDKAYGPVANDMKDFAKGQALFAEALQIQIEMDPNDDEVAYLTLDLASSYNKGGNLDRAFELGKQSADMFEKRRPGSDSQRRALGFTAQVANARKDYASALALTEKGLALTTPTKAPDVIARLQLQRAKALIATHRPGSRKLLEDARVTYEAQKAADRVQEIDELLPAAR